MVTDNNENIILSAEVIKNDGLENWAKAFKLGTAGYRDQLDPDDINNPEVAFNRIKVAIIAEARASVSDRLFGGKKMIEHHIGGEVRPHTSEFIDLAARIYAAHGHRVHLRKGVNTTPIWYSSFGVFYNELTDGENFTASHSPKFKGGWKPMDGLGKQLIGQAQLIANEVRKIIVPGYLIKLAPPDSHLINRDFDATEAYCEYVTSIIPEVALDDIRNAQDQGFITHVSTVGGSMGGTAKPMFKILNIDKGICFHHEKESSDYHGIGMVDGVNYGVDPGKWQVYKNIGAQEILKEAIPSTLFCIWDPDGDRFNIITTAPSSMKEKAITYGLEVEDLTEDRILVYFKPNQIYFMLTIARIEQIRASGELDQFDWVVFETFPTSRSIGEIAQKNGLKVIRTPVGFKYFGEVAEQIEEQIEEGKEDIIVHTPTNETISVGKNPRILIMAEESGGAAMGGTRIAVSKNGMKKSIALKEKDGFQIGLATMALAARLFFEKRSFAQFYQESIEGNEIEYRFYERLDITLYDENLPSDELAAAKQEGISRRDNVVSFFKGLIKKPAEEVFTLLKNKMPDQELPPVKDITWAGDGTLIDFEGMWWEIRASGTDAILRYYIEGRDLEKIKAVNRAFSEIDI